MRIKNIAECNLAQTEDSLPLIGQENKTTAELLVGYDPRDARVGHFLLEAEGKKAMF